MSAAKVPAVKFMQYYVESASGVKAKVSYHTDNRSDGRKVVTIYAADYGHALYEVLPVNYENKTDMMTDYFDKGTVRLFEDSPYYAAARARAEANNAKREAKWEARKAKWAAA